MRSILCVFVGLTLLACNGEDDETSAASDESEVSTHATRFGCGREDFDADLGLRFSNRGTKVVADWGLDNIVTGTGSLDPTYRPTPENANFVRFTGFRGIADDAEVFAGGQWVRVTLLVEKPMLEGKPGRAKLQMRWEHGEFEQTDNACLP